ncbi:MAG: acylphosphatase [Armatimonadetes bacterium]|nr:acylphosphatase [Armatimonadota bacterium]
MKRLEAVVEGRVQDVGYRYFVQMAAIGLHVNGRVSNLPDGKVKIVAEGDADTLEQLISALWQGPRSAVVDRVREQWSEATGEFREFAIDIEA